MKKNKINFNSDKELQRKATKVFSSKYNFKNHLILSYEKDYSSTKKR